MAEDSAPRLALIGFGEAGATFARVAEWAGKTSGWDILPERRALMEACCVTQASDAAAALADADIVLSLVTADAALGVARDYAPLLRPGAMWCDMNSVSPGTKRAAAAAITAAGARYVDVAVMAPVDKGLAVPLRVSGSEAQQAMESLSALGFSNIAFAGDEVGRASAIKLCRSVMVKGLEALTAEMVLAANEAGVLDEVLASLDASERDWNWQKRADYNLDRMLIHGRRRAAEMAEASAMLSELGISPMMSDNTVKWQQGLGETGDAVDPMPEGLAAKLAAITATSNFKGES